MATSSYRDQRRFAYDCTGFPKGALALLSMGWSQGRAERKLPSWPRWHRLAESVSMTCPWGYWGSLEVLLICDRTAARLDMGRCRRGEVNLHPLTRDQSAKRLHGMNGLEAWSCHCRGYPTGARSGSILDANSPMSAQRREAAQYCDRRPRVGRPHIPDASYPAPPDWRFPR